MSHDCTTAEFIARKLLRSIQQKFGHTISPEFSVFIGRRWNAALSNDPSGKTALEFVQRLEAEFLRGNNE